MKVKLNRKIKVFCLPCEVEVDEMEAHRLMLLNAICLFMMLAITNPLTDKDYANEMIIGTSLGCLFLCIFSSIDFVKYYAGQYRLKFDVISK